jgi:hypothetical protein
MPNSTASGGDTGPVTITPFADEASSTSVGDLAIENRLDRVSVYGSLDGSVSSRARGAAARRLRLSAYPAARMASTAVARRR